MPFHTTIKHISNNASDKFPTLQMQKLTTVRTSSALLFHEQILQLISNTFTAYFAWYHRVQSMALRRMLINIGLRGGSNWRLTTNVYIRSECSNYHQLQKHVIETVNDDHNHGNPTSISTTKNKFASSDHTLYFLDHFPVTSIEQISTLILHFLSFIDVHFEAEIIFNFVLKIYLSKQYN